LDFLVSDTLPLLGGVVGFTPRLTKSQLCHFLGAADDCSSGTRNCASDWIVLIVRMVSISRLSC
jgi:hypothetical protein